MRARRSTLSIVALSFALATACGGNAGSRPEAIGGDPPPAAISASHPEPAPAGPHEETTASPGEATAAAAVAPEPVAAARVRAVVEQRWTPFATVGPVTLHHPGSRVEMIGFHEANHTGARQLEPAQTAAAPLTVPSRERGTGSRSAADIVLDPAVEVRAPVTGRVKRAGSYVLYCRHTDSFAVIEPDGRPGWEVKVLHVHGLSVKAGARVVAGETVIAAGARQLPFESQVDRYRTADPAWPHVHLEVVDTAIKNLPNKTGSNSGGC